MAIRSIRNTVPVKRAPFSPAINTGFTADVATGKYLPGVDGRTILNGGIALTTAVTGRPQMYKSTDICGLVVNACARSPESDMLIYDTEKTLQEERIIAMSTIPFDNPERVRLTTKAEYYAEDFLDIVAGIAHEKTTHAKDYVIETPFLNRETGKAHRMLRPTFVGFDSWSNMSSREVDKMILSDVKVDDDGVITSKNTISESGSNTFFMRDGLVKKKMIKSLNAMAEQAGIYLFFSAHVGDKVEMNPYAPVSKGLQYMKNSDKVKGAGSDFMFLMMTLLDCREVKALSNESDRTQSLYPTKDGYTSAVELNELTQVVSRCKGNASGTSLKTVISQTEGPMDGLTNYHYLKTSKYWGLSGSQQRHSPVLMPDVTLTRTTVNDMLRADPKLCRALEILAQLCYIQKNWSLRQLPEMFSMNPEALAEALLSDKGVMNEILESRGWWTYDLPDGTKGSEQQYFSLPEILNIADGINGKKLSTKK